MTTATSLGSSSTVNPFAAFPTDPAPSADRLVPGGKKVTDGQAAGSLQPKRAASDKSTQVAFAPAAIAAADALLIAGVVALAYISYLNMTSEADRRQVIAEVSSAVRDMVEAIPGLVAPAIGELKSGIRSLFQTMDRAGADLGTATDVASKWLNERFGGEAVPIPELGRPDTTIPQAEQYTPSPLPTYEPLQPRPSPQKEPERLEPRFPYVPSPEARKFNADELGARIQKFAPHFGGVTPGYGIPLEAFEAEFLAAAAQYNRVGGDRVAVCVKVQYQDPATKQSVDGILIYAGLDPSKVLTQFENFVAKLDATKAFNVIGDFGSMLNDVGLSVDGLQSRARGVSDVNFANGLPSAGGRRARAGSDSNYEISKANIVDNNEQALALGHLDRLDVIVPCKQGRHFFMQGVTRGQIAGLLNWAVRSGHLRDNVSVRDVIHANGLDSVLGLRGDKVVPLTPAKEPQTPPNPVIRRPMPLPSDVLREPATPRSPSNPVNRRPMPLPSDVLREPATQPPLPNPVSRRPMPLPSDVLGEPTTQPPLSNPVTRRPMPLPSDVLGKPVPQPKPATLPAEPQRVGWINLSTRTFSTTRHGAGDLQVTARFVTQRPTGPNVFQITVNPTTGHPGKAGDPGVVDVDCVVRPLPGGRPGIEVEVVAPGGGGGGNKPPGDNKPPNGNGDGPGKWNLAALANAAVMLGFAVQGTYGMQVQTGRDSIGMSKIDLATADKQADAALAKLNKNSTQAQIKTARREIWRAYLGVGVEALQKLDQNKLFNVVPMGRVLNGADDLKIVNEGVEAYLKRLDGEPLPTATSNAGLGPLPNNIEIPGDPSKTQHVEAILKKAGDYAIGKVAQIPQRLTVEAGAAVGDPKPAVGEFSFKPFPVAKFVQDSRATTLTGPKLLGFQNESRQKIYLHFLGQVAPRLKPAQRAAYTQAIAAWTKNDTQDTRTLLSALAGLDDDALRLVTTALGQSKLALDELHRLAPNVALSVGDQLGQALNPTPAATPTPGTQPVPTNPARPPVTPAPGRTPAPGALPTQSVQPTPPVQPKGDPGLTDAKAYRERLKAYTGPTLGFVNAAMVPGAARLTTLSGFAPTEAMFVDKRLPPSDGLYQAAVKLKTLQDQIGSNFKALSAVANDIARNPNKSSSPELQKLEQEIASLGKDWNKVGVLQNRIADRLRSLPPAPAAPSTTPSATPTSDSPEPRTPQVQPSLNSPRPSSEPSSPQPTDPLNSPTPTPTPLPLPAEQR